MKTLAPSDMLCFSLYAAGQAMQQAYKPLLAPLGLTYPQYLVMSALWTEDGQTVGTLGRTLGLASNTLTPLLKRLEARGLITRARVAEDERQVRIALTEAGHALADNAAEIPACILEKSALTEAEAADLRGRIFALRDALQG